MEQKMIVAPTEEILCRLARLTIEPVKATLPDGSKLFMERINGSTKFLSHMRKVIYDVAFENTYYHSGKIPQGRFIIDNMIYKIEESSDTSDPERFIQLLEKVMPKPHGMRFYLDETLYLENVSFMRSDIVRDDILKARKDGPMLFDVLRIIDPSNNITEFHASPSVQRRMKLAGENTKNEIIVN